MTMEDCNREEPLDSETGEIRQVVTCLKSERLAPEWESKEPQMEMGRKNGKKFHVPISYVQGDFDARRNKKKGPRCLRKRLGVECIEESVIHGTQNVSPIVFMLPTLLICPAWTSIFCVLCEACIHILSHKRNKMRTQGAEYKSPLHLISSEFCGYCRSRRWKEKIKQIQEKRSLRRKFARSNVTTIKLEL